MTSVTHRVVLCTQLVLNRTQVLHLMPTDNSNTDDVWAALRSVIDPELRLDVVTLGLIYGVERDGATARITYTLTTPGCPMERAITGGIREAVGRLGTIARVDTHLVWDPEWHPGMIARDAFPE